MKITRKNLLLSTLLTTLTAVSTSAYAQDADQMEEMVVTGSRFTNPNLVSTSPVTVIDDELFDVRGTFDTIDLVNTLPSAFAGQTTAFANGATGTSTLNLRGLGAVRTLVLVDGKRLPPGGPLGGFAADLNLIAPQLVESVEVVTGGASAVYGSDAIAGVANFILRKDFEGIELDVQGGFNQSTNNDEFFQDALEAANIDPVTGGVTDNATLQLSGLIGTGLGDGRGNVTGYFNWSTSDGIQQGDRDFAQCATFPSGADDLICLGSNAGPFPTTFFVNTLLDADGNQIGLVDATGAPILNADGTPQTSGAFSLNAEDDTLTPGFNNAFNFNPFNPIRREVERFNAGFNGYYDFKEDLTAYLDFGFTSSSSPQIIAPSAAFNASINQVNCDNPLLTEEQLAIICGTLDPATGLFARDIDGDGFAQTEIRRRFVEGGPRTDDRTRTNFRVVGGFRGTLADNFDWDIFGQYSETQLQRVQFNQVTAENLALSLDIVSDPVTGDPICRSVLDGSNPDCLPFTSAFQIGVPSDPGLPAFVDTPTLTVGTSTQNVFGATIGGDLSVWGAQSPWADEGVNALIGVEYREDTLFEQADGIAASGGLVGAGGATVPTNGETEVFEIFGEVQIPLISDKPFIERFNVTGAYRYSDYSSEDNLTGIDGGNFGVSTFAVGATWEPTSDLRIRGQFQRAIRAPNVLELFSPQNTGLTNLSDPCSGSMPTATAAQCANTGLSAAQFGLIPPDSGQLNTLTGGNPNLTPEVSDTFTIGAVWQPSQVEGLTVSADYFDITVENAIGTIPTATTLNQCLETGAVEFCSLIQRGPDGTLTTVPSDLAFISAASTNIAEFATTGIDLQIQYNHDLNSFGDLSFNYNSTILTDLSTITIPGTPSFDCVGFFADSCGNPNFAYRHNLGATWNTPWKFRGTALWRFFSGVNQVGNVDNGFDGTGNVTSLVQSGGNAIDERIDSTSYLDLAGFYDVNDELTLRMGVNNVLDSNPPIVTTFGTTGVNVEANTVAGVFDAGGRFLFAGATFNF